MDEKTIIDITDFLKEELLSIGSWEKPYLMSAQSLPCAKAKPQQGDSEQNTYPCTQSPLRAFERL